MQNASKRPPAHLDRDKTDRAGEEWRSVVAYDGYYEVSNQGRVRSLARLDRKGRRIHARVLAQECSRGAQVQLSIDKIRTTFSLMALVADAFLPGKPAEHHWYHKTENVLDNSTANIVHGTWSTVQKQHYALGMISPIRADGTTIGNYAREYKRKHDQLFGHFVQGQLVAQVCTACLVEKPIALFMQGGKMRRKCRECLLIKGGVKALGKRSTAIDLAQQGLRRCGKCGNTKQLDNEFHANKSGYLGRANICTSCVTINNAERREYRRQRVERIKAAIEAMQKDKQLISESLKNGTATPERIKIFHFKAKEL